MRSSASGGRLVVSDYTVKCGAAQVGGLHGRGVEKSSRLDVPLITIVTSTRNAAKHLPILIESIHAQIYRNFEWIVVDGGSNDGTLDILRQNEEAIDCWISEPDKGIYDAWNKGLRLARGEWLCFLGADDCFWDAQVLERMAAVLQPLPYDTRVVYGQIMLLNQEGQSLYPVGEPWQQVKERFKQLMCIPHPGAMHRRSLFEARGGFDMSFRIAGDYELLLRELKSSDALFVPDLILVGMRHGGVSSDPNSSIKSLFEVRRAQRMHGEKLPGWLWLLAIARVYIRLMLWRVLGERLARKSLDLGRRLMKQRPMWTRT